MQKDNREETLYALADKLRDKISEYYGEVCDRDCFTYPDVETETFNIYFVLYNYAWLYLMYENGDFWWEILDKDGRRKVPSERFAYSEDTFKNHLKELDEYVLSLIPEKYIDAKGWRNLEDRPNWELLGREYAKNETLGNSTVFNDKHEPLEKREDCLKEKFLQYFGGRVSDIRFKETTERPGEREFEMYFRAYRYFDCCFGESYRGGMDMQTMYGGEIGSMLPSTQEWHDIGDLDVFFQEMKIELELRIPDDYLKAHGWK